MTTSLRYILIPLILFSINSIFAFHDTEVSTNQNDIEIPKNPRKPFNLNSYMADRFSTQIDQGDKESNMQQRKSLLAAIKSLKKDNDDETDKVDEKKQTIKKNEVDATVVEQKKNLLNELLTKKNNMLNKSEQNIRPKENEIKMVAENFITSGVSITGKHYTFEEAQKWVKDEFLKISEIYGATKSAEVINLFLIGNYPEFLAGLKRGEIILGKLEKRSEEALKKLNQEIKMLEKNYSFGNAAFSLMLNFSKNYQELYKDIKDFYEFTKQLSNFTKDRKQILQDLSSKLSILISKYKKLKIKYHNILLNNEKLINKIIKASRTSYFALKDLEIISDRFLTLLNSLRDFKILALRADKPKISEDEAKKSLNLITLYSSILRRLKTLEEDRNNALKSFNAPLKIEKITLPIGKEIEEFQYLMKAKNFIEKFFENPTDISSLNNILKMKSIFNNNLTSISINTTQGDPTFLIKNFDDSVIKVSSKVFSILKDTNYNCEDIVSFIGDDITEIDTKYGGCLSKKAYNLLDRNNAWYSAEYAVNYIRKIDVKTVSMPKVIELFMLVNYKYKNLNPILAKAIKNVLKAKFKLIMDSYDVGIFIRPSSSENTSAKKEESLITFVANDIELGSSRDQKQIANSVAIKTLEKTCDNFINNFSSMINSLENDVIETLLNCEVFFDNIEQSNKNSEKLKLKKLKEKSQLIDNKFKDYVASDIHCKIDDSQENKTRFIFKAKNTISEEDIKNMLYILTKNADKVKTSSLHVIGMKYSDNKWILSMIERLKGCLFMSILKINNLLQNESNETYKNLKSYL